jgi:hypothetical protein
MPESASCDRPPRVRLALTHLRTTPAHRSIKGGLSLSGIWSRLDRSPSAGPAEAQPDGDSHGSGGSTGGRPTRLDGVRHPSADGIRHITGFPIDSGIRDSSRDGAKIQSTSVQIHSSTATQRCGPLDSPNFMPEPYRQRPPPLREWKMARTAERAVSVVSSSTESRPPGIGAA